MWPPLRQLFLNFVCLGFTEGYAKELASTTLPHAVMSWDKIDTPCPVSPVEEGHRVLNDTGLVVRSLEG